MLRRRLPRVLLGIGVLVAVLLHVTRLVPLHVIDAFENFAYDARVRLSAPHGIDDRIVIVDIDESSLRAEGRWPWSRTKLKELVDALFEDYGVALVGFDVVFAERDENRALQDLEGLLSKQNEHALLHRLRHLGPSLNRDRIFADALSSRSVVLGYYFNINPERTESHGLIPDPVFESTDLVDANFYPPKASSYGGNLAILQTNAASGGFFSNPLLDSDGIVRRIPMLHEYRGALYESLSLSVVRTYLDEIVVPMFAEVTQKSGYPSLERLGVGNLFVPIDANGAVLVPYRGPKGSFPYVSATKVLGREPLLDRHLQGRIALVGTTALGLVDLRTTPMHAAFPGVEIHANVISGMLDQTIRHRPAWTWGAEIALVLALGLILIVVSPFLGPLSLSVFAVVLAGVVFALNLYLWRSENLVMPLASNLLTIVGIYLVAMIHGFFSESRSQRRIRNAFNHYMAPTLVKRLVDDPRQLRLSGETREMTFLFSDLVGFTALTERSDPETLVRVLNEYLDGM
ncbi:MAG: CHASE2 domain-containing protein, partial [Gammaproteobacteria bacterium]|nr:CHASE2 domain-containing protein [Gammaproteobacteria bacterium]